MVVVTTSCIVSEFLQQNLDELPGSSYNWLPLADVQSLTGSLVLERALKLGLDCGEDPVHTENSVLWKRSIFADDALPISSSN